DYVLARVEQARVQGPSIQLVTKMREWLDPLHDVEVTRLPFDDRAKVALEFESVAADDMLAMTPLGDQALDQGLARTDDFRQFARVEHVAAEHESALIQFPEFRGVKAI